MYDMPGRDSMTGSMVSNISNCTVDPDVDYNQHICQIVIGIFDEYLRKEAPNKVEVDEEIISQLYEKFGCTQMQVSNPLLQRFSTSDSVSWDTTYVDLQTIQKSLDKFLFYSLYKFILD